MKLEIETDNLPELVNALNNAIVAYHDVRSAIWTFGGLPEGISFFKWEKVVDYGAENFNNVTAVFDRRLEILYKLYSQLCNELDDEYY